MNPRKIVITVPFTAGFKDVAQAIKDAIEAINENSESRHEVIRAHGILTGASHHDEARKTIGIAGADLVIADTTGAAPGVIFDSGVADALDIPTIFINQREQQIPHDLGGQRYMLYDRDRLTSDLIPRLTDAITSFFSNPEGVNEINSNQSVSNKLSAFVSYSHVDTNHLQRLQVHVRPLEDMGTIEIWADTRIKVGDKWKEEVEAALDRSVIAVLLISADFLASSFIVNNELPPILAAAEAKGTRILPVILKPCRFSRDENLSQFQAVNSPSEPLLTLDEVNQEHIWDKVAQEIESEIQARTIKPSLTRRRS